jgi:hypothetical protein
MPPPPPPPDRSLPIQPPMRSIATATTIATVNSAMNMSKSVTNVV